MTHWWWSLRETEYLPWCARVQFIITKSLHFDTQEFFLFVLQENIALFCICSLYDCIILIHESKLHMLIWTEMCSIPRTMVIKTYNLPTAIINNSYKYSGFTSNMANYGKPYGTCVGDYVYVEKIMFPFENPIEDLGGFEGKNYLLHISIISYACPVRLSIHTSYTWISIKCYLHVVIHRVRLQLFYKHIHGNIIQ